MLNAFKFTYEKRNCPRVETPTKLWAFITKDFLICLGISGNALVILETSFKALLNGVGGNKIKLIKCAKMFKSVQRCSKVCKN
jgi:hypothetical protein